GTPLQPGGISRAPAATQPTPNDLVDHFARRHLREGVDEGAVAVVRDVVFDAFGIDIPGILQDDLLLPFEKGNIGAALMYSVAAGIDAVDDLGRLVGSDVGVHLALALYGHQRARAAQSHASDALHQNLVLHARFHDFLLQGVAHLVAAG